MCKGNIKPVIGTKNVYVVDQFEKAIISIFSEKKTTKKKLIQFDIYFLLLCSLTHN